MTENTLDLNAHQPGYSVLSELWRQQKDAPQVSGIGRLLGVNPLKPESIPWYKGYLGELEVGKRLNRLREEGYTVLHGVQPGSKDTDVDHLVITPAGFVYTINTKHHKGAKIQIDKEVWIGGTNQHYVRNLNAEHAKVQRVLHQKKAPIFGIESLLVFVNPGEIKGKNSAKAKCFKHDQVVAYIRKEEVKRNQAIAFHAAALTEPTYWRPQYDWEELRTQQDRLDWYEGLSKQMAKRDVAKFGWTLVGLGVLFAAVGIVLHIAGIWG